MKILLNWLVFLLFIFGIYFSFKYWYLVPLPKLPTMTSLQAVTFGFASAFLWVEVLRLGSKKPFNCLKCMAGWFTVVLALLFHVEFWPFYLPLGVMVGAIFSAIKMRWL